MVYIEVGKDNIITRLHYAPFDPKNGLNQTKEDLSKTGYFVDSIPESSTIKGKRAVLKYNADIGEVYYDYETIPLNDKERIDALESIINDIVLKKSIL